MKPVSAITARLHSLTLVATNVIGGCERQRVDLSVTNAIHSLVLAATSFKFTSFNFRRSHVREQVESFSCARAFSRSLHPSVDRVG
jgi:hypothetical protein